MVSISLAPEGRRTVDQNQDIRSNLCDLITLYGLTKSSLSYYLSISFRVENCMVLVENNIQRKRQHVKRGVEAQCQ